jgi:DNA-binding XRE family transcriptional regulator
VSADLTIHVRDRKEIDAFYQAVGARIAALRSDCGLTQEDLAKAVGLSRPSISNLEAGRQRTPIHVLVEIASLFGMSLADLVVDSTPRTRHPVMVGLARDQAREITRLRGVIQAAMAVLSDQCAKRDSDRR